MEIDKFGIPHCTTNDLCDLLYIDPQVDLYKLQVDDPEEFNSSVRNTYYGIATLNKYKPPEISVEDFDAYNQSIWCMPDIYKTLDIAKWVLDKCITDEEKQRVGKELLMYQERDLFNMLRFMKYFVDQLREHNIVWGVGRGSSVASYVLFLIGVHKIDALYYDLDIEEFLK